MAKLREMSSDELASIDAPDDEVLDALWEALGNSNRGSDEAGMIKMVDKGEGFDYL